MVVMLIEHVNANFVGVLQMDLNAFIMAPLLGHIYVAISYN